MLFSQSESTRCKKGNHMQITGSSALVVGGAGGLGEATVRRLHGAGAKVVVADLADEKGGALEEELGVRYVRTDATSTDDVNAAIAAAEALGPLRISVDTHGGPASGGRLVGKDGSPLDLEGFKTTINFYLTAVFNVMRLSAAAIARTEPVDGARGVIVNTASIAGYEGQIGQLPYSAAKGGVISMTLVAARDLSPLGIRVVTIAPGMFLTPAYPAPAEQLEAHWGPQIPFPKRMGQPAEYAAMVASIVENDYLNGEVIRLDAALRFPPK
jgi:NAD(P)-dependent dehydrogenase (short-subunit alcohol dehydrogenase family)